MARRVSLRCHADEARLTAQQIVASAARWRAREGKSTVFQASLTRGKRRRNEVTVPLLRRLGYPSRHSERMCEKRVRGQAEAVVEEQVFGTFTQELERLHNWLKQQKVRQVAMESTGVYWIPIWNVLERRPTFPLDAVGVAAEAGPARGGSGACGCTHGSVGRSVCRCPAAPEHYSGCRQDNRAGVTGRVRYRYDAVPARPNSYSRRVRQVCSLAHASMYLPGQAKRTPTPPLK